jgi:pantetheine-phosphate adenylyltransferase
VVGAVGVNSRKKTFFSAEERIEMVKSSVKSLKNVQVDSFNGLLVNYARAKKIHVLLRGLRAFSDFEYEFQMALANRKLAPEIEMIFLMPKETHSYISSSTVREISDRGGDISQFVPPSVKKFIEKRRKL